MREGCRHTIDRTSFTQHATPEPHGDDRVQISQRRMLHRFHQAGETEPTVETRITGSIFSFHLAATVSRRSKIKNTSPCVMRSSGTMKVGMKYVACNIPGMRPEALP
jgi:hypothetical protein